MCTLGTEPGQPDHGAVLERQVLQGGGGGWLERVRRPGAETRVSASGEQPLGAGSPEPWGWGVRTRRGWNGGCPDPRTGQTQPPPLTHLRPEQARPQTMPCSRCRQPREKGQACGLRQWVGCPGKAQPCSARPLQELLPPTPASACSAAPQGWSASGGRGSWSELQRTLGSQKRQENTETAVSR